MGKTIEKTGPLPSAVLMSVRPVSAASVHLDALRGAAALLVFLNHTRALYFSSVLGQTSDPGAAEVSARNQPSHGETSATSGQIAAVAYFNGSGNGGVKLASEAVVIFFVLSGYLVGGSALRALKQGRWSWRDYLIKRLTRLWVPLIPCLILCVCLDRVGYRLFASGSIYHDPPGIELTTAYDLIHRVGIRVFLGNVFFLQGIAVPHLGTDVSLWSLANEFWYYLAFPCMVLAVFPRSGCSPWGRVVYSLLAVAILFFTGKAIATLFPIWLLGAAIAVLPGAVSERATSRLSLVLLFLLLACMLAARVLPINTLAAEYIVALASSAFLYFATQQRRVSSSSIYRKTANYFSKISYTLYIVHLPTAIFLASIINSPWHRWPKTPTNLLLFFLMDGVVLLCATLLWRLFEANTDAVRRVLFERSSFDHIKRLTDTQAGNLR